MPRSMHDIIQIRKYLHNLEASGGLTSNFIENIEIDSSSNRIIVSKKEGSSSSTIEFQPGLEYLKYDSTTDRIVSSKAIETTLNSLFLRDQHRITSGAENIFFSNNKGV